MNQPAHVALGLDFGTESVRALLADLNGNELASAVGPYEHGQITETLPGTGEKLPADFAFQHPSDWIEASAQAVRDAVAAAGLTGDEIIGIGVDFTSCTMLPALSDGTPLCLVPQWATEKFAWPKLWKHHGAKTQTEKINELARARNEPWLARYGGIIGLEWFFPKMLETLEEAPAVYDATEVWLEAGDWYVWQLVDSPADKLPRSTCQAGYKGMWHSHDGFPSHEFLAALHPKLENVVAEKMPGKFLAPGEAAGTLCASIAEKFGLPAGIPVSAATIDAHAGVPGAGAAGAGTLVMVMGTSSCHMLNADAEQNVPGVAGIVEGGILPGFYGYETGQAAVGDAFDWLRRTTGHDNFDQLTAQAAQLSPGADGVLCMDWFNGCRTPLMDGGLRGAFVGLTMNHGAGHMYRALMEGSAFGVRWIVDLLRENGVPVTGIVATGGLPHHNPLLVQIYADVLGLPITVHPSKQGPALGAAILGVLAADTDRKHFATTADAIAAMAGPRADDPSRAAKIVEPEADAQAAYENIYQRYRKLADVLVAEEF
ncbi:Ribulokinase [Symmachiella macrocystis]|uniref:Ribulokinase n=1 Tax=Symmachiella macrocystis TaxID=2527985 RepID=A0A5C6BN08_9PLAN|nr:ribulokinase [Symmachiella macrocystis]TWU13540.1 Ribulokinase [Symmachiella macrocystis]